MDTAQDARPELSVVVPAHNEADNLPALLERFGESVIGAGVGAELIAVDDGSTDETSALLRDAEARYSWLRAMTFAENLGQSAAFAAGIRAARGVYVGMLDADGQNDPADLVRMLDPLRENTADLVQGRRVNRRDAAKKKLASTIGRLARRVVLSDRVYDTGCSCRVARAALARSWPLHLRGMHRFIPALSAMHGARIREVDVSHRPRRHGASHYRDLWRGVPGFFDLLAVRWMRKRWVTLPEDSRCDP